MLSMTVMLLVALSALNACLLAALVGALRRTPRVAAETPPTDAPSDGNFKALEARLSVIQSDIEWLTTDRMIEATTSVAGAQPCRSADTDTNSSDHEPTVFKTTRTRH
ncbi:MAG: hypothetical protein AAFR53_08595 [Pseudomonadota bacterium]